MGGQKAELELKNAPCDIGLNHNTANSSVSQLTS